MIYLPSLGISITHMRLMYLCGEDVVLISGLAPYLILGLDNSGWTNSTLLVTTVSEDELELDRLFCRVYWTRWITSFQVYIPCTRWRELEVTHNKMNGMFTRPFRSTSR